MLLLMSMVGLGRRVWVKDNRARGRESQRDANSFMDPLENNWLDVSPARHMGCHLQSKLLLVSAQPEQPYMAALGPQVPYLVLCCC